MKRKKRTPTRYYARLEGSGKQEYYKVRSGRSKKEYAVALGFNCSCPYHTVYPYDLKVCKVVRAAMMKMVQKR